MLRSACNLAIAADAGCSEADISILGHCGREVVTILHNIVCICRREDVEALDSCAALAKLDGRWAVVGRNIADSEVLARYRLGRDSQLQLVVYLLWRINIVRDNNAASEEGVITPIVRQCSAELCLLVVPVVTISAVEQIAAILLAVDSCRERFEVENNIFTIF